MRPRDSRYDGGRVLRAGFVVLGLAALAVPLALALDDGDLAKGGSGAAESVANARGQGTAGAGTNTSQGAATRGEATGGVGLTSDPAQASGTSSHGKAGTARRGEGAFAMSPTDITESFDSLTKQQQARVMQRCKDVIAKPGEHDPNQLALCQTLAATTKR